MLISTACGCPAGADASVGKGEFAIALGCFDGVHIGHAELFRTLVEGANGKNVPYGPLRRRRRVSLAP